MGHVLCGSEDVFLPPRTPRKHEHAVSWRWAQLFLAFPLHQGGVLQTFVEADFFLDVLPLSRRPDRLGAVVEFYEEIELLAVDCAKLHRTIRFQCLTVQRQDHRILATIVDDRNHTPLGCNHRLDDYLGEPQSMLLPRRWHGHEEGLVW